MLFKNKKLKTDHIKSEIVVIGSNTFTVSKASAKLFEAHTGSIVNKEKIRTKNLLLVTSLYQLMSLMIITKKSVIKIKHYL